MRVNAWQIGGGRSLEIKDTIVVNYGADSEDVEVGVLVELDHSPAEPDVGVREESFSVTAVRYASKSGFVEERFITSGRRAHWEERAPVLVTEYEAGVKDFVTEAYEAAKEAAMEAKADARRDGDK
jgi:hypothetical protein